MWRRNLAHPGSGQAQQRHCHHFAVLGGQSRPIPELHYRGSRPAAESHRGQGGAPAPACMRPGAGLVAAVFGRSGASTINFGPRPPFVALGYFSASRTAPGTIRDNGGRSLCRGLPSGGP
eukprot:2980823-Lingulodinium_polyedra.AAC.1